MKKTVCVLILFLLLATASFAQKKKSDREDEGLKGKVKTVRLERVLLSSDVQDSVRGKRMPELEETYDPDGNLVKQIGYDYRGNIDQVSTYSVGDDEKLVSDTNISHGYNPPPPAAPPGAGQSKEVGYNYSRKYKYLYDDKGNRKELAVYRSNGRLIIKYVNTFDAKGNKIESVASRPDGLYREHIKYAYDSNGNETERTYLDPAGSEVEKYSNTYELDAKGNWIKQNKSKVITKDGKTILEPYEVSYRIITYY